MTINSRQKGARGEREAAEFLRAHGFEARRSQQFCGADGTADLKTGSDLAAYHIEVKRTESGNPYNWLAQAKADSQGTAKIPVVFHKRNHRDWIAVLSASDFLEMHRKTIAPELQ